MARYIHKVSGARVEVRDDKVMDSSWESVADDSGPAGGGAGGYEGMKVADLKAEIDRRNEGRGEADLLSSDGKKADLVAVLEADDAARSEQ